MARRLKLAEIGAAGLAVVGFWLHSLPVLFVALFCFGIIAALFGPIKYGILPDHLRSAGAARRQRAGRGRDLPGDPARHHRRRLRGAKAAAIRPPSAALMMGFAVLCWAASLLIPRTGEAAPDLRVDPNILRSTGALLQRPLGRPAAVARRRHRVSWFWLVGAVMLSLLPPLVKNRLGGTEEVVTAFLAVFSVAHRGRLGPRRLARAAAASCCCRRRSARCCMGAFGLDLACAIYGMPAPSMPPVGARAFFARPDGLRIAIDLAGLAIAGGLFIVPSFAAVQAWAGADRRARVIAAVNVLIGRLHGGGRARRRRRCRRPASTLPTIVAALGVANVVAGLIDLPDAADERRSATSSRSSSAPSTGSR